jgi:hypothetical protein
MFSRRLRVQLLRGILSRPTGCATRWNAEDPSVRSPPRGAKALQTCASCLGAHILLTGRIAKQSGGVMRKITHLERPIPIEGAQGPPTALIPFGTLLLLFRQGKLHHFFLLPFFSVLRSLLLVLLKIYRDHLCADMRHLTHIELLLALFEGTCFSLSGEISKNTYL